MDENIINEIVKLVNEHRREYRRFKPRKIRVNRTS